MVDDESSNAEEREAEFSPAAPEQEEEYSLSELQHYVPEDILNVSFPVSVRGYDRRAVDSHLKRVNRLIAEVKVGASPRAAVTHALEQTEQPLQADTEAVRKERRQLLDDIREEASGLLEVADAAAARQPAEPGDQMPEPEAVDDIERAGGEPSETSADDAKSRVPRKAG